MSLFSLFKKIPVQALIKYLPFGAYILSPSSGLHPEHRNPVSLFYNIALPILFLPQNLAGIPH